MAATGRSPTPTWLPLYARARNGDGRRLYRRRPSNTWMACIRPAINTRCRASSSPTSTRRSSNRSTGVSFYGEPMNVAPTPGRPQLEPLRRPPGLRRQHQLHPDLPDPGEVRCRRSRSTRRCNTGNVTIRYQTVASKRRGRPQRARSAASTISPGRTRDGGASAQGDRRRASSTSWPPTRSRTPKLLLMSANDHCPTASPTAAVRSAAT